MRNENELWNEFVRTGNVAVYNEYRKLKYNRVRQKSDDKE